MSTDSAADAALLVEIYRSLQLSLFCDAAVNGLLAFDWILTLRDEMRFVWANPMKLSAWLYFGGRYMPLVQRLLNMISVYPLSDTRCEACYAVFWTTTCAGLIFYVVPIIFSANRAYALSDRNKILFCIVFVLSAGPLVINMQREHPLVTELEVSMTLHPHPAVPPLTTSNSLILASRLSSSLSDIIVILVTWKATFAALKAARGIVKAPIAQALLFNGARTILHNAAHPEHHPHHHVRALGKLPILPTATIPLHSANPPAYATQLKAFLVTTSYIAIFIDPLTSVLTSRFLLDLQRMTATQQHRASAPSRFESLSLHMSFVDGRGRVPTLRFAAPSPRSVVSGVDAGVGVGVGVGVDLEEFSAVSLTATEGGARREKGAGKELVEV
ncbi:hypothetical protein C8Q78DRAFT_1081185 [Trametes maxima]|nr:hypothetical protein C8Q78DRAFT_1081185 [Trametes maxima]